MKDKRDDPLALLVEAVRRSSKYRSVSPDLIQAVGARELRKRPRLKDAIKATKNKLHQAGGAFLDRRPDFEKWMDELKRAARTADSHELRRACVSIMSHHASTRERVGVLDHFYETTLKSISPVRSVIDVACGLNPLSIPWMQLDKPAEYHALDIYEGMVSFLNEAIGLFGVRGGARAVDVTRETVFEKADLALLLKAIPCLEQIDKEVGRRLLDSIDAPHLLVSFPAQSLCGKSKGMAMNYEARFRRMIEGRRYEVRRYEFDTELAFLVSR